MAYLNYWRDPRNSDSKLLAHAVRDGNLYGTNAILVRVLQGGKESEMGNILTPNIYSIKRHWNKRGTVIKFECLTNDEIKNELKWSMKEVVDWLLKSDVHLILCHPHQGCIAKTERWNVQEIYENIDRLEYHLGFPMGPKLRCPVFTQNKYEYIKGLGAMANPTCKVDFPESDFPDEVSEKLTSFVNEQKQLGYRKFIVKKGYVTNSGCVRHLESVEDIQNVIIREANKPRVFGYIPYALVQPQMSNENEIKVICWNRRAMYVFMIKVAKSGNIMKFPEAFADRASVFAFAETAIQNLEMNCPSFIADGLVRVDIFVDDLGTFRVNEIESLEGRYATKRQSPCEDEVYVKKHLPQFWVDMTNDFIVEAISFIESLQNHPRDNGDVDIIELSDSEDEAIAFIESLQKRPRDNGDVDIIEISDSEDEAIASIESLQKNPRDNGDVDIIELLDSEDEAIASIGSLPKRPRDNGDENQKHF